MAASVASATSIADPCVQGTLQDYLNMSSAGEACSIGALTYGNFQFSAIKPTTTSTLGSITADKILVRPEIGKNTFSLLSNPFYDPTPGNLTDTDGVFNQTFTQLERYFINYIVDPPPIIAGDELTLDPPTGPVVATKWGCTNSLLTGGTQSALINKNPTQYSDSDFSCTTGLGSATPYFLQVTTESFPSTFTEGIVFPTPVAFISAKIVLDFGFNARGEEDLTTPVTGLDAINNGEFIVPEPATNVMIASALLGLAAFRRRFSRS